MDFPTKYSEIQQRLSNFDPFPYGGSRNYLNGGVSYLSPYISRGVISTKQVMEHLLNRGIEANQIIKFIQELAWRDYWQQIWVEKGEAIDNDLKNTQEGVVTHDISSAIPNANTGISAIDIGLKELHETGYMHNHMRMYVSMLACNMGQNHWRTPAKWMYYHLLDADWASNALSWQWIAGANSNKKYIANQENINKYSHSNQTNTYLDVGYEELSEMSVPDELQETTPWIAEFKLSPTSVPILNPEIDTALYTFYNLDPNWLVYENMNRILILEPSHFNKYPISQKTFDFVLALAKNIKGLEVFIGEFSELAHAYSTMKFHFKEHPFNRHFIGKEHSRDWMFSVKGYYPSFFKFWNKCRKELKS